jgi:hypothetical protein
MEAIYPLAANSASTNARAIGFDPIGWGRLGRRFSFLATGRAICDK